MRNIVNIETACDFLAPQTNRHTDKDGQVFFFFFFWTEDSDFNFTFATQQNFLCKQLKLSSCT